MKIAIASHVDQVTVGGLAAYQRELASGLQSFSRINGEPLSVQQLPMNPDDNSSSMKRARWVNQLASRGPLMRIADTLSRVMNYHPSWTLAVNTADVIHFIGTGWEITGHPLWREAGEAEVPFTVWPSVHPENCKDEAFDLQLYQEAEAVFCQSDHELEHLISRGVAASKLIRCGLPPMCPANGNGTRLRSKLGIGMRPAVLFVGRRDAGKGYPALLEAWPLVLRQCPDAVLLLAGPGDADEAMLANISPENVRDLGCPPEQEKADAYAACDVFCLPSAYESFGIVYVEAWSYGKPVICGTAPASRELVEHGVTGVWADQQPQQLSHSLLRLLMYPDLRHRIGLAGLRHQLVNFTTEQMVGCHLKAWKITAPKY
ncbi:MAG: glycosyltransferase family 4 protein [Prosthecobacter sp.]|uniref:glycosyltransferase family 4 protein n=1 Tax=Prosthecobacter sp. TaxID=1965333 RepID=UPI0025CBD0E8|nr:glycosyltransferase family 4 protein [Prosthecobacter sp.]MCF7787571.1 glycosyltransferase family 4 protein [Prosthecobacter sp.]